ncbi:amino acid permease [Paenibacillus sp. FJAT-26967]|uniref:amino acid permease n=1 Tax=Paenibacillus sp. FJAT-26967 TaxID=1729690 RepID=UPI000838A71F|nr:amino acid permease [Paenibacillus sp. FJAT-26967]
MRNNRLNWWHLSLFGVGCTIGSGFFLGSGIAIARSGIGVLVIFSLAALAALFVYEALAQMMAVNPSTGSFRTYAREAFGRPAGFSMGWMYWSSEILILGSTLTALGIFSQIWLSQAPLWLLSAGYALLGLFVVVLGSKSVNRAENFFAIIKIAAVMAFILIVGMMICRGSIMTQTFEVKAQVWGGSGLQGAWKGFLYAFYAYGGIEVMGFMGSGLRRPEDAPKAGRVMLASVTLLYTLSLALVLWMTTPDKITPHKAPIISALETVNAEVFVQILNGVMIVAGFSILVASLYAVSTMLLTLAQDGDAPKLLAVTKGKRELPLYAILVNTSALSISIVLALLLPKQLYEHLSTAAGLVILYTWLYILASYLKLLKPGYAGQIKTWIAILLIMTAVSGTLAEKSGRPGFWFSLLLVSVIGALTFIMKRVWARRTTERS